MKQKWLIGVDEAGRGPLAGPVAVGVVKVAENFDWSVLPGVNDSKKLSEAKREAIFKLAWQLRKEKMIDWSVRMSTPKLIDERGIVFAIKQAQARALSRLAPDPTTCLVKLDGGLAAPSKFIHQVTIIKGDQKEKVIGLASVLAKVTRDRYMQRIAPQYAGYDFATHKGYGTKAHRLAIASRGLSCVHRQSFCGGCVCRNS